MRRKKITIEALRPIESAPGQTGWSPIMETWAEHSGRRLTIRFQQGIDSTMRIKIAGEVFYIRRVIDFKDQRIRLLKIITITPEERRKRFAHWWSKA